MEEQNRDPQDGLIPREQVQYENLNEKGIQALRFLARSMVQYDRSTAWHIRTLRWLGIDWVHLFAVRLWIDNQRERILRMLLRLIRW